MRTLKKKTAGRLVRCSGVTRNGTRCRNKVKTPKRWCGRCKPPSHAATADVPDPAAVVGPDTVAGEVDGLLAEAFAENPEAYASGRMAGWMRRRAESGTPLRWADSVDADVLAVHPTDDIDDKTVTEAARCLVAESGNQPLLRRVAATAEGFRVDSGKLETCVEYEMPDTGNEVGGEVRVDVGIRHEHSDRNRLESLCTYTGGQLAVESTSEHYGYGIPADGEYVFRVDVQVIDAPLEESQEEEIAHAAWSWVGGVSETSRDLAVWAIETAADSGYEPKEAVEMLLNAVRDAADDHHGLQDSPGFRARSLTPDQSWDVRHSFEEHLENLKLPMPSWWKELAQARINLGSSSSSSSRKPEEWLEATRGHKAGAPPPPPRPVQVWVPGDRWHDIRGGI